MSEECRINKCIIFIQCINTYKRILSKNSSLHSGNDKIPQDRGRLSVHPYLSPEPVVKMPLASVEVWRLSALIVLVSEFENFRATHTVVPTLQAATDANNGY